MACKLCKRDRELRSSHIVPRFVGRYLKRTSATGFLLGLDRNDNAARTQDLETEPLLCNECEGVLNESETFFANTIFYPYQDRSLKHIPVDERLGRFAVSLSLRSLWMHELAQAPLVQKWRMALDTLEQEWREYLLGAGKSSTERNSHHVFLSNEGSLASGLGVRRNLVFSILRSSAFLFLEKFDKSFFFSNLAGIQVISMVSPPELPLAHGSEVFPTQTFGVDQPHGIGWGGYYKALLDLAEKLDNMETQLTENQKAQTDRAMRTNPKRTSESEDLRVLRRQEHLQKRQRTSDEENET